MSSYSQKYHLRKVEPVKSRAKISEQDIFKHLYKKDKATTMKISNLPPKRKIAQSDKFIGKQLENDNKIAYKTQKNIIFNSPIAQKHKRENQERKKSPQTVENHREHKSVNFRSSKTNSTGTKILNTLQNFFYKIVNTNQGCLCGDQCPWEQKFFKWTDVPHEIVKNHYQKILKKWKVILQEQSNESSNNQNIKKSVENTKNIQEMKKNLRQIQKDIDRTQSQNQTFQKQTFKERQKNILMNYSIEDSQVGYVQGMNMILSGILYHVKDEIKTYAIFRKLIYSIRSIYLQNFEQCYTHISQLKRLMKMHLSDVYEILEEIGLDLQIICLPWILSLLTCIVPLEQLHLVYDGLIIEKWRFIYKVCLSIFIYHKEQIKEYKDDASQILKLFSVTNEQKGGYDWQDIILFSNSLII